MSAEAIALNPSFGDRHFRLWHGTQDEIELSIESKMGLSFYNSPTGEEGANVLFVAAEFANQHHYEDNRQSDQREHEEKSEAHHGVCLLSCLSAFSINSARKGLIKVGQRPREDC